MSLTRLRVMQKVYTHDEEHPFTLKGTITVFLALIFVCVCALVLTLVESARTAGLRFHLDNAAASSMDSLFSEYHNEFWNQYRITAYECEDTGVAMSSLEKYMQPYLNVKSWMRMDSAHAQLSQVKTWQRLYLRIHKQ